MAEHDVSTRRQSPAPSWLPPLLSVAVLAACFQQATAVRAQRAEPGSDDVAGSYVLRSVDGRGVNPIGPITGGFLEVGRDGQWNLRVNWRGELGNARTYGDRGT